MSMAISPKAMPVAENQNRTWKDQYMLRLPDGMRDRIRAAAERNNRSMNAEIVATLEEKYPPLPDAESVLRRIVAEAGISFDRMDPTNQAKLKELIQDAVLTQFAKSDPAED
jgi:hypothetical protein